jgi:dipeptidase E
MLLMSSSRYRDGGFLEHAAPQFSALYGDRQRHVLFIPYASICSTYDEVEARTQAAFRRFGQTLDSIHHFDDPVAAVENADAIAIAGGNTFALLKRLLDAGIVDAIRRKVLEGAPYLGWSAGSNITNPTIRTTNDMPVVFPPTSNALNLIPFQTNPHFVSGKMPGHNGESREDRLIEYLRFNPEEEIVAMPEGVALLVEGEFATVMGPVPALWFRQNGETRLLVPGTKFALNSIHP